MSMMNGYAGFGRSVGSGTMDAQGFDGQLVQVQAVDTNNNVTVIDRYGRYFPPISVFNIVGSGALPQVGDIWLIDRTNGGYTFRSRVQANLASISTLTGLTSELQQLGFLTDNLPASPTVNTLNDVIQALQTLGLVNGGGSVNATMGPGTIVDFAGLTLQSGWLWCDGAAYVRTAQPNLWNSLSIQTTANTHGTTTVDNIPAAQVLLMLPGMPICGANIPAGATISSILSTTSVQISIAATGTTTGGSFIVAPWGVGDGSTTFNVPDLRDSTTLTTSLNSTQSYSQQILSLGPQGFWKLNEVSGTTATDSSTTANSGTYTGTYTLGNKGPFNYAGGDTAAHFDGSTAYVSVPYNAVYNTQTPCVEAWVNPASMTGQLGLFEKSANGNVNTQYLLFFDTNGLQWRLVDTGVATHDTTWTGWPNQIGPNNWYHIVAQYDGQFSYLWVNGVLVGSLNLGITLNTGTSGVKIGQLYPSATSYSFNGYMGQVAFYNKVMANRQILMNYRRGVPLRIGQTGGFENTHLLTSQLPPHNHGNTTTESGNHIHASVSGSQSGQNNGWIAVQDTSSTIGISSAAHNTTWNNPNGIATGAQNTLHVHGTSNTGGDGYFGTLPPYGVVTKIIKT